MRQTWRRTQRGCEVAFARGKFRCKKSKQMLDAKRWWCCDWGFTPSTLPAFQSYNCMPPEKNTIRCTCYLHKRQGPGLIPSVVIPAALKTFMCYPLGSRVGRVSVYTFYDLCSPRQQSRYNLQWGGPATNGPTPANWSWITINLVKIIF